MNVYMIFLAKRIVTERRSDRCWNG